MQEMVKYYIKKLIKMIKMINLIKKMSMKIMMRTKKKRKINELGSL